jgi:glucokinase
VAQVIVAGDVGGTHARLGAFSEGGTQPALIRAQVFASRDYKGLVDVVREFLGNDKEPVKIFCFGVAGPVDQGVAHATNLHWALDERPMSASLGAPVLLINDLEANAYGIATLGPGDIATLQTGEPGKRANQCVVSAGTGLGEAGLFWDGAAHRPFACEGGHTTFAPGNKEEIALLEYLMRGLGHVSWERLLSGPGLHNIYKFLRDTGRGAEPAWLAEQLADGDPASAIAEAAIHGKSELCEQALDMFIALYGSEAGNMALKTLSLGGVYLGGGIAPRIVGRLREGVFAEAFAAKGRMRGLLEKIPIHVIVNDRTALKGAARCGALHCAR